MTTDPIRRSVMVFDVESSSTMTNPESIAARAAVYRVRDAAIEFAGLAEADFPTDDRGDGLLIVTETVPVVLLDPFVERLSAALQEENAAREASSWLRLRVALHAGPVHVDAHGWSGDTVNATFALCNAPAVKATLRRADRAQLVLVVSDLLYKEVVRHRYRSINPASYGQVDVARVGEPAWVRVPGYPAAPVDGDEPRQPAPPSRPPESALTIGNFVGGDARGNFVGGDVNGGTVVGRDWNTYEASPTDRDG
jgi:hypothetical protein